MALNQGIHPYQNLERPSLCLLSAREERGEFRRERRAAERGPLVLVNMAETQAARILSEGAREAEGTSVEKSVGKVGRPPLGTPSRKAVEDAYKRLKNLTHRISFCYIKITPSHTSHHARTEWGEFRQTMRKSCTTLAGVVSCCLDVFSRISPPCLDPEWLAARGEDWKAGVSGAVDVKTLLTLIKELDSDGLNWAKHELLNTVLDAVDMIPYSQVVDRSSETWEYTIPKQLQDADRPAGFCAALVDVDAMINDKSKIRDVTWKKTQKHRKWLQQCSEASTWDKAEKVNLQQSYVSVIHSSSKRAKGGGGEGVARKKERCHHVMA